MKKLYLYLLMVLFMFAEVIYADEIEGTANVWVIDYEDHTSETIYAIDTADGEVRLGSPIEAKTGERLVVSGVQEGSAFYVNDIKARFGTVKTMTAGGSILFVIGDFNDGYKASTKLNARNVSNAFFEGEDSMASYIQRSSYGNVSFQGGEDHIYNVNLGMKRSCDYRGIVRAAERDLTNRGVDLGQYDHISVMADTDCGWAGVASVGGYWSVLASEWALDQSLAAHELGHNFGMHHSSTPGKEYGDNSCPMGGVWDLVLYNAPQTHHTMRWTNQFDGILLDSPGDGDFEIKTWGMDMDNGQPAMVRLSSGDDYYYVSYRQRFGQDDSKLDTRYLGVNIHIVERGENHTLIKVLNEGESFKNTDITVSVVGTSNTGATVRIGENTPPPPPPPSSDCDLSQLVTKVKQRKIFLNAVGEEGVAKVHLYNGSEGDCEIELTYKANKPRGFSYSFDQDVVVVPAKSKVLIGFTVVADRARAKRRISVYANDQLIPGKVVARVTK